MQLRELIQTLQARAAELPDDTEVYLAVDFGDRIEHATPTSVTLATQGLRSAAPHVTHLVLFARRGVDKAIFEPKEEPK
jgi:hypothetical protein